MNDIPNATRETAMITTPSMTRSVKAKCDPSSASNMMPPSINKERLVTMDMTR
jgi:hypothetical protein